MSDQINELMKQNAMLEKQLLELRIQQLESENAYLRASNNRTNPTVTFSSPLGRLFHLKPSRFFG